MRWAAGSCDAFGFVQALRDAAGRHPPACRVTSGDTAYKSYLRVFIQIVDELHSTSMKFVNNRDD